MGSYNVRAGRCIVWVELEGMVRLSQKHIPVAQLTGSKVEYLPTKNAGEFVRKSTQEKPDGQENDRLFFWDTRQIFLHDGTDWREF